MSFVFPQHSANDSNDLRPASTSPLPPRISFSLLLLVFLKGKYFTTLLFQDIADRETKEEKELNCREVEMTKL